LKQKKHFCDVIFKVSNDRGCRRFPCHRMILAACSPLFEAMLYANPLMNNTNKNKLPLEVHIQNVDPDTFECFLECIYTDDIKVTSGNISQLLELGKKYQVEKVQMICSEYLAYDINLDNALKLFDTAPVTLGDHEFGIQFIRENIEELFKDEGVFQLSQSRLLFLMKDDYLEADELFLFNVVKKFAEKKIEEEKKKGNKMTLKEGLGEFLKIIRFPTFNPQILTGLIGPLNILSPSELSLCYRYAAMTDDEKKEKLKMPFSKLERVGGIKWNDSVLLTKADKKPMLRLFGQGGVKMTLLFRASKDGMTAQAFHTNCDNKGPTLILIKPANETHIFGGFYTGNWQGAGRYTTDESWIFSLRNPTGQPLKLLPIQNTTWVYVHNTYGPTFGGGHDIYVNSNFNSGSNYCNPHTYKTVAEGFEGAYTTNTLAGSYNFTITELEVFEVKLKK